MSAMTKAYRGGIDAWMKDGELSCPWPRSDEAILAWLAGIKSEMRRLSREVAAVDVEERRWERHVAAERAAESLRRRDPPSCPATLKTFAYRFHLIVAEPDEAEFLVDLFLRPMESNLGKEIVRIA